MIDPLAVRRALFAGEMLLEYLPTVRLSDGRSMGCEALVRWLRDGRIIPPLDFVPIIENTPVAGLLTYWVIDTIGREMGDWMRRCTDVSMAVNIPPDVLGRGGIQYAGYKANLLSVRSRIVLEITERGAPDRLGLEELKTIADSEVMIAMDDVAVDENNLLVLSRVPVDLIKVDRDFVAGLVAPGGEDALRRLQTLITIGRHTVVAEGVETPEQARLLHGIGVQYAQGWLFSRPLPAAAMMQWHAEHSPPSRPFF